MVGILEITLSDLEKDALWQQFSPLLEAGAFKALIDEESPAVSHLSLKLKLMHFARQVFADVISEDNKRIFERYKNGEAEMLVLNNMPERTDFDSGKAVPGKNEVLIADFMSFMYAALLGNNGMDNLKLDTIFDSNDDNIHQDSLIQSGAYAFHPADYVSLQCINPGQGKVMTLYMDLHDLIEQLPVSMREALQKPDFALDGKASAVDLFAQDVMELRDTVPDPAQQDAQFQDIKDYYKTLTQAFNGEPSFGPLIVKEAGRWNISRPFTQHHLFSSGLLPNLRMTFRNSEAKAALLAVRKEHPKPAEASVAIEWTPGKHVISRQAGLYHRRYAPDGGEVTRGRCLNRARFYASNHHGPIVPGLPGMNEQLELSAEDFRAQLSNAINDCRVFAEHEPKNHQRDREVSRAKKLRKGIVAGEYERWCDLLQS